MSLIGTVGAVKSFLLTWDSLPFKAILCLPRRLHALETVLPGPTATMERPFPVTFAGGGPRPSGGLPLRPGEQPVRSRALNSSKSAVKGRRGDGKPQEARPAEAAPREAGVRSPQRGVLPAWRIPSRLRV